MQNRQPEPHSGSENSKSYLFMGMGFLVGGLLGVCLQYLKPSWWWENNTGAKVFRSLVGEWLADKSMLVAAISFITAGVYLLYVAKQKFEERSRNNSTESD